MASNPMQRKVRNSFLLGIFVMLAIAILIGAVVFFTVMKPKMDKEKEEENQIYAHVYRLKTGVSVKYGEEITDSMVESVEIPVQKDKTNFVISKKKNPENPKGELIDVPFPDGYKSKIEINGDAIISYDMIYEEKPNDSLRLVEYNVITLPITLETGDYIDVRLRLPNGQDLIVLSKKEVVDLNGQTVGLQLNEEEILLLNNAIVENFVMPASELYMARYVEADIQAASTYTYTPTPEVAELIRINPNIINTAKEEILKRFLSAESTNLRNTINNETGKYAEERKYNIEAGMQQQIEAARKAREDYLSELEGY